jgi:hypothetical protein
MAAEIMALLPGMDYQSLMDMYWEELRFWHEKAVNVYKALHGMT